MSFLLLKITLMQTAALMFVYGFRHTNPRWRMFFCEATVLAVLLLPLTHTLPWTISFPIQSVQPPQAESLPLPLLPIGSDHASTKFVGESMAELSSAPASKKMASSVPAIPWSLLYATGLIGLALRFGLGFWHHRRRLQDSQLPKICLLDRFHALAKEAGFRALPRLRLMPTEDSPYCSGLRHGTVVVPRSLVQPDRSADLDLVLRHELHHLAHRDLWRRAGMAFFCWVLWFHPLAWWLRRCHHTAMEELADRIAAAQESETGAYRRMLAALALRLQPGAPTPLALGMFLGSQTIHRLRRLASPAPHQPLNWEMRIAGLVIVIPMLLLVSALQLNARETQIEAWRKTLPKAVRGQTEKAIAEGLVWLRERQREDGSLPKGGKFKDSNVAATSFTGMTFFQYGGLDADSPLHPSLTNCLHYVLSCQNGRGWFLEHPDGNGERTYAHAVATWFLASLLPHLEGEWKQSVRDVVPVAARRLIVAQNIEKKGLLQGGWRYTSDSIDSDLSCTGWAVHALAACRKAGVEIPDAVFRRAATYALDLKMINDEQGSAFGYTSPQHGPISASLIAKALRCIEVDGKGRQEKLDTKKFVARLQREVRVTKNWLNYSTFWATSVLCQLDAEAARDFAGWMIPHFNRRQKKDGGWDGVGGDVLATAWILSAYGPRIDQPLQETPKFLVAPARHPRAEKAKGEPLHLKATIRRVQRPNEALAAPRITVRSGQAAGIQIGNLKLDLTATLQPDDKVKIRSVLTEFVDGEPVPYDLPLIETRLGQKAAVNVDDFLIDFEVN